jgi:transcriptional regulator with XRE-family HTH domain
LRRNGYGLGRIIKQSRVLASLTLKELSRLSNVSPSYLGRIEGNKRFPSADVLRKIARPLGFDEAKLFVLAGYLPVADDKAGPNRHTVGLDPHVARELAKETAETQFAVLAILEIFHRINKK